jgi:haloalkane dehalogenase
LNGAKAILQKNLEDIAYVICSVPDPLRVADAKIDAYFGPLVGTAERRRITDAFAAALAPNPLVGTEKLLQAFHRPVRILWGMAVGLFAASDADYLDALFKQSQGIRRLPDAKLFLPEEQPQVIAAESRALWRVTTA